MADTRFKPGHEVSPEVRAKLSILGKSRTVSQETREKTSATMRGRERSPEHCANLSAALLRGHAKRTKEDKAIQQKARSQQPEIRERRIAYERDYLQRPDVIEQRKAYRKAYQNRPEAIARRKSEYSKEQRRAYHLQAKYGLSLEAFASMLDGQGGACAVCGSSQWGDRGPIVDHDHDTGIVRGIVCRKCNTGIGMLGDNLEMARAVVDYLERGSEL